MKLLSSTSIHEALRQLVSKSFIPRVIEGFERGQYSFSDVIRYIDEHHLDMLSKSARRFKVKEYADSLEALFEVYNVLLALLNYPNISTPVSFMPSKEVSQLKAYIDKTGKAFLNPYVERLVNFFRTHRRIDADIVSRIYDSVRMGLKKAVFYHELLVAGLAYDISLMRLCSIDLLKDTSWRPLLLSREDLETACKLMEVDPLSALDSLKKNRPLFQIVVSIAVDASKLTQRQEIVDIVLYLAPSYCSNLLLHAYETSEEIKNYFLLNRQSFLLRLALTLVYSGDSTLLGGLKNIIERWVYP